MSSAVKELMTGGFVFDGPARIVGMNGLDPRKSGTAQFPSGPVDARLGLSEVRLFAPAHGDTVLVRPAGDYAVGLVDLKTGKGPMGSQMSAMDVYDDEYSRPRQDGSIGIFEVESRRLVAAATLQGHWIGPLRAAEVSPDMKWFAASATMRGAVWNLATGERVFHVRGFSGCGFSAQNDLYADFSAYFKEKRSIGILDLSSRSVRAGADLSDVQVAELGRYLIYVRRAKGKWNGPVDLEVHDVTTGGVLWEKHFAREAPEVSKAVSGKEMALLSSLVSDEAREEEKGNPQLLAESKGISSKDTARLVQVVNAEDGKLRGEFAVDTGKGSFRVQQALPAGKRGGHRRQSEPRPGLFARWKVDGTAVRHAARGFRRKRNDCTGK